MTALKDSALAVFLLGVVALRRLESGLALAEKTALVALLSCMVVLSFLQVALRQFLGTGLLWGDTLSRHMVIWAGFFGAALATMEGKHFAWETFVSSLKGRAKSCAVIAMALCCLAITVFLAQASWVMFLNEKEAGAVLLRIGSVAVPSWAYSLIYPCGFALLSLHLLIQAVGETAELLSPGWGGH
ncbi:MAG: TRAP transporter small permease [Elusimicrobia bacterium]|nr:TRAP transporter small permease [Elusimicrobiota bacterium]